MHTPDFAPPPCAPLLDLLTRRRALMLIFLVWAAIYVPTLGSLEIKGEEGRRLLPAVAMLQSGRWIVPSIGGVDYLSKPPLVNWLAAGAFHLTGSRSEWAARAPSALSVLALGVAAVWLLSAMLTPAGALLAAVFMLTNIGLMEKGRLAEIEALYISLFGLALLTWWSGWWRTVNGPGGAEGGSRSGGMSGMGRTGGAGNADGLGRTGGAGGRFGGVGGAHAAAGALTRWRTWALPGVFLGLGLLTKGPLNLVFFYAVVLATLAYAGRLRDLWNLAHLAGLLLAVGIFAAWAYPYMQQTAAGQVDAVWRAQLQGRLEIREHFRARDWLLNVPRGLVNFLPWALLLPLLWRRLPPSANAATSDAPANAPPRPAKAAPAGKSPPPGAFRDPAAFPLRLETQPWPAASSPVPALRRPPAEAVLRGGRLAAAACFLLVSIAPGGVPRYTLPLLVPASVLLALVCIRRLPAVPPILPVVWSRIVAPLLALSALGALPAAAIGGADDAWRWLVAAGVLAAGAFLLIEHCRFRQWGGIPVLALSTAGVMALLTADFSLGAVPHLRQGENLKFLARKINRATAGQGESVRVFAPGYLPFLYYLRPDPQYVQTAAAIPPGAHFLLVRELDLPTVSAPLKAGRRATQTLLRLDDKNRGRWYLLRVELAGKASL